MSSLWFNDTIEVDLLQNIATRYVVNNLSKFSLEALTCLPVSIKNLILKEFCYQEPPDIKALYDILSALVNSNTSELDLRCLKLDDQVVPIFKNCVKLRRLYMRNDLSYVCKHFPIRRLRHLAIELKTPVPIPNQITSTGLCNILKNVPNLECLVLEDDWKSVDNSVLKTLSDHCPKLYGLDIRNCSNISDKGMNYLGQLGLKWLKLSHAKITDKGLSFFVQGKCTETLEEFEISKCLRVTKVGLSYLSESCQKLTTLHCDSKDVAELSFPGQMKQLFWEYLM